MNQREEIQRRIEQLNEASEAYYQKSQEIMPNVEYDRLYDELVALERETGIIFANSPTQNVGYEVLSSLPKESHPSKMLSLDKTKDREALASWLGDQEGILSWKLDGLTIVLTYEQGRLVKALTRGNGEVGEVVTGNARCFSNLPIEIPYRGKLVLRGEAIISYEDFSRINREIDDETAKYKNPRNLCSGSVRQLDPAITKARSVRFVAFSLVSTQEEEPTFRTRCEEMEWLRGQGFEIVEGFLVDRMNVVERVRLFEEKVQENNYPSDGLVLTYDDIAYGESLGTTAKFPRDAIAFKWADQKEETVLREIEWSASRTGLINPVAIFDPVELEGTTVSRASVHNLSIMEELALGIGDRITVYKANMIIPQIDENLTRSGNLTIPEFCPVCGSQAKVHAENEVKTLHCENPECPAKQIKRFTLLVSRDALNIEGLSEATLEKLIDQGIVRSYADLFQLEGAREKVVCLEGFGEKSFDNLIKAAEKARHTTPDRLLYALGIPGIGLANARLIALACHNKWEEMEGLGFEELQKVDGIGAVMAENYTAYFQDARNREEVALLRKLLILDESEEERADFLSQQTFVITGSLHSYANRDALKAEIERAGGKVAGSVSKKTAYLINNDVTSSSGKNKKAKELGIPIIDEDTIRAWLEKGEIIHD